MDEKQYWSMDELLSLTEKVQEVEVEYGEKFLKIQWCELTEAEEPKMVMPDESLPEEEKTKIYVDMAADRVKAMMSKAMDKNPEGSVINIDESGKKARPHGLLSLSDRLSSITFFSTRIFLSALLSSQE